MDMDVGSIISRQISQMAQSNSSRLGFPALITALCIIRGFVPDSLTFESLSPTINLAYIRKNCWNLNDPTITFLGIHDLAQHRPIISMEDFMAQVAWPGVQPSSTGGGEAPTAQEP
ncbi:hypothetical protein GmHk_08G023601 [Glycine max]|nr:hypothetical protein GmHk_08G023601 [Glycine max]